MLAELEDFQCEPNQIGRFEIHADLQRRPELGLALALMGFTPIHMMPSGRGDFFDVVGLSSLFVAVPEYGDIPIYTLEIVRHADDGMIDPSVNYLEPFVIELHLRE